MSRILNFDYTFVPASNQVQISGNVSGKRLLLINNVTAGIVIYNIGDTTLKPTSITYNSTTNLTTITLSYNCSSMSATDTLQIFVEKDSVSFIPDDSLIDGVGKHKVSEPNTLIDTDFEYGLQGIKWETLQKINNIPSAYSTSGNVPLNNVIDVQANGTNIVTVVCSSPHNLAAGTPIDIRGLSSSSAEGTYIIRRVTANTFSYTAVAVQGASVGLITSLYTANTYVVTGGFYAQAFIPLDTNNLTSGTITTDANPVSSLTVRTPYSHGFSAGSNFYLTNTLSNRSLSFSPQTITNASGNVEDRATISLSTGNFNPFEPVHAGSTLKIFDAVTYVSTSANTITIPNHGLITGDMIAYLGSSGTDPQFTVTSPTYGVTTGSLLKYGTSTGSFMYVNVIDPDTIKLASGPQDAYNGNALFTFTSAGTGNLHFALFNKRGSDISSNISSIVTTSGTSNITVNLSGTATNKSLGIYPKMQFTFDGTIPALAPSISGNDRGVGVYVVSSTNWSETGTSFVLSGPTNSVGTLVNQTSTATYNISYTAASAGTLLRYKSLESTLSPTISTATGAVVTFSSNFTPLGNGDSPVRVGSHVRFTSVGSLTGITANTDYFVSAVTTNSITLSSTNPAISTTAVTIGGTVGAAVIKIFPYGLRAQLHTSPWINHTRASIHDWVSISAKSYTKEAVVGNQIYLKNHGLSTAEPILHIGGGNTWGTGPADKTIYFILPVTGDQIAIYTTETVSGSGPYGTGATSQVTFTTATTAAGGVFHIHPGFMINAFTATLGGAGGGRDRVSGQYSNFPSYVVEGAPIVLTTGTLSTLPTPLTNTPDTYTAYQKYYTRTVIPSGYSGNAAEFSVSLAPTGSPINFTGNATIGAGRVFAARIIENPYSNSFFLPNHGGYSSTNSTPTQRTTYSGTTDTAGTYPSTAGYPAPLFDYTYDSFGIAWPRIYATLTQTTPLGGLATSTAYYMIPVTNDIWKVQNYNASNIPTGQPTVQITSLAGATNAMSFANTTVPHPSGNRIVVPTEQQPLSEGSIVRYQSQGNVDIGSAFAGAPGLINDSIYTAKNINSFYPLSTGLFTAVDLDSTSTVLTLNASSSANMTPTIASGNTLYTGGYLQEQLLVTAVSGVTVTVTRGYNGTTATFIPAGTDIFKVYSSVQLGSREVSTPRTFSGLAATADTQANGSSAVTGNSWAVGANHYLRTGDPIIITGAPSAGSPSVTNTLTGATYTTAPSPQVIFYAIPISATSFQLASSKSAAYAGFPLRITSAGTTGGWSFTQFFDCIPLTGAASSSGNHSFVDVSPTGTLDGSYSASSVTTSGIVLSTGVNIPNRVFTFNPVNVVNLKTGEFYIQAHGLTTGTPITYSTNGNAYAVGTDPNNAGLVRNGYNSLTNATTYFVIRKGLNSFQLATTKANSLAGVAIQNFSSTGTTSSGSNPGHTLTTSQVAGEVTGNGLATITVRDSIVDGSSTAVVLAGSSRIVSTSHGFNTGDRVIYQVWGNGTAINGLVSGTQYFVNNTVNTTTSRGGAATGQSANQFSLHTSWVGAYTNTDLVRLYGVGTGKLHHFKTSNPVAQGTFYKGDWNASDSYVYGDVVNFRNNYYMSVCGTSTGTGNSNQQPASDAGVYNYNWMLLPALPNYSTTWSTQYRPGDTFKVSNPIIARSLLFNGSSGAVVNTTTNIITINGHGLSDGDAVVYKIDVQGGNYNGSNGGYNEYVSGIPQTAIGGLTANQIYYVNVIDANNFTLATSPSSGFVGGSTTTGEYVALSSVGTGSYHRFDKIEYLTQSMSILSIANDSQMIVSDPFPTRQLTFNPQTYTNTVSGLNTPVVSIERNEFYIPNHGLNTGTKVLYSSGFGIGTAIGGLTDSTAYYIIKVNDDVFRLASSLSNALTLQSVTLSSTGSGFYHYLVASTIAGSSYVRYTNATALAADTGFAGTNFYTGQTSANILTGVLHAVPILSDTQVYTNPNSLIVHRPFDGGVETAVGQSPNCSVIRQTRKYFRYQAGKGFSYSSGINFASPIDVAYIKHDGTTYATVTTRRPHKLSAGNQITITGVTVSTGSSAPYTNPSNGLYFTVNNVIDDFNFRYATNGVPTDLAPGGFPVLNLYTWSGAYVRAGMFDDQNGAFLEYDGSQLWAVRRNSTQQLTGSVSATYLSNTITGVNTVFTKQLTTGTNIVIRGMSYTVTGIASDTSINISPAYRGSTGSSITATITVDTRTPSSQFSNDKLDGTGRSGYIFNPNKIQMIYITWSWYGAGKIKYGLLDGNGRLFYFHEYIHNNTSIKAYMRSGNLPARYEVLTGSSPTYYPTLYHWGVSIIMDGKFENDFNYLFTAASGSAGSDTITIPSGLAGTVVPILSLRLAPSVAASLVGNLGDRDLINRMKISLNSVGIVVTNTNNKPCSVRCILNPNLSQSAYFTNQGSPSLSQIIKHTGQTSDLISGGLTIFEFRAAAGSQVSQDISTLTELGNSITGGNYNFPNGPDILTIAVVPTDTAANTSVTARISWSESQS